jgi:hypothetical protein
MRVGIQNNSRRTFGRGSREEELLRPAARLICFTWLAINSHIAVDAATSRRLEFFAMAQNLIAPYQARDALQASGTRPARPRPMSAGQPAMARRETFST